LPLVGVVGLELLLAVGHDEWRFAVEDLLRAVDQRLAFGRVDGLRLLVVELVVLGVRPDRVVPALDLARSEHVEDVVRVHILAPAPDVEVVVGRAGVSLVVMQRVADRPRVGTRGAPLIIGLPHGHDAEVQARQLCREGLLHVAAEDVHVLHALRAVEAELDLHEAARAAGACVEGAHGVVVGVVTGEHARDGELLPFGERQIHEGAEVVPHQRHAHPDHVQGDHEGQRRVDAVADARFAESDEHRRQRKGDEDAASVSIPMR
jgi:hypothetical protein